MKLTGYQTNANIHFSIQGFVDLTGKSLVFVLSDNLGAEVDITLSTVDNNLPIHTDADGVATIVEVKILYKDIKKLDAAKYHYNIYEVHSPDDRTLLFAAEFELTEGVGT